MNDNGLNWIGDEYLQDDRVIGGNDCKLIINGHIEKYAEEFEWGVENDKKGFSVIGSEWEYEKDSIKKGTFKISIYKTDSALIRQGFNPFEIIATQDAGQYGAEKIRLKNCKLKKLGNSTKAGDLIKEEWEGSFSGIEPLQLIEG
ncbi:phage tail tube protein [Peptostreptococcus anaerobius]